jgi:hypothetical protein
MLFIGTPLYENKVSSQYLHGLMQTANLLARHGLTIEYALELGTYIAINRERLVRKFLKSKCHFFLFIDADTVFTPQDVLALLSADLPMVSGIYRYRIEVKKGIPIHSFRNTEGNPVDLREGADEIQECAFVPTGMLMIRRDVFEQLYAKHEFIFDQGFRDTSDFRKLFGDTGEDEVQSYFEGEDVHLSKIWREMGGKIFVNTSVRVDHIGEKVYKIDE